MPRPFLALRWAGRTLTVLFAASMFALAAAAQQIAFTFDDLPAHGPLPPGETRLQVIDGILAALHAAGVPPLYGFVNGVRLEENPGDAAVLDAWRKAGNPLGNHTWSHMNLNQHTVEQFEADVLKNEPVIASRMQGQDWKWFRYPYLAEGANPEQRNAVRDFLRQHGYKVAAVTMSFGDYLWNEPYARCMAKGDKMAIAKLESSYLQAAADDADYRHSMANALFGHDIPYVLLMHVGAFDAHMLPRLLALYRSKGYSFIQLPEAEKDAFYANDLDLSLPGVPDTLEEAMVARHLPLPPAPPANRWLADICQ